MKAAVRHEYGSPDVLHVEDVPTPTPRDREVLIRVHAASVNLGDWELLTGQPRYIAVIARIFAPRPRAEVPSPRDAHGLFKPKYRILGCDIAGRVEAVGRGVTQFQPGDEVFGDCGIAGFGGFAEYVCVPERAALVPKPAGMTFEQAAAVPQAASIALHGLHKQATLAPGMKVLINGAGGGAGTFAVQIAKTDGAEVTGVDGPDKLEMLHSIGADHVIDYTREEFTRNGQRYDVILDLAAYRSVFETRRSLTRDGIYLMAGGSGAVMAQAAFLGPLISMAGNGRVAILLANWSRDDLTLIAELFESGKVVPVIDGCYPLGEAGNALRRLGEKRSLGKVIITP